MSTTFSLKPSLVLDAFEKIAKAPPSFLKPKVDCSKFFHLIFHCIWKFVPKESALNDMVLLLEDKDEGLSTLELEEKKLDQAIGEIKKLFREFNQTSTVEWPHHEKFIKMIRPLMNASCLLETDQWIMNQCMNMAIDALFLVLSVGLSVVRDVNKETREHREKRKRKREEEEQAQTQAKKSDPPNTDAATEAELDLELTAQTSVQ